MIKITISGLVLGLLLLALPLYVMFKFRLRIIDIVLASFVRMAVTMGTVGGLLYLVVSCGALWLNALTMVAVPLAGALYAVRRSRLSLRRFYFPVAAGMVTSTLLIGLYVLFLVLGADSPLAASLSMPVAGVLTGAMAVCDAKALHAYYVGLENHRQLYDYLLGNGATHRQAVSYFVRRALEANIVPCARVMAYAMASASPALVWGLLMGGVGIWQAVAVSVVLAVAAMSASVLSLVVALAVARRYCFDDYQSLRADIKQTPSL